MHAPVNNLTSFTVLAWVYHESHVWPGDVLVFINGQNAISGKIYVLVCKTLLTVKHNLRYMPPLFRSN